MIKYLIIKNNENKTIDVTNIVKTGSTLKKSIKEFAWVSEFKITKNKEFQDIEIGDILVIQKDTEEVFSGIIISGDITNTSYKAVDYSWYFSKNQEIYQFVDVEASICVTKLIETFGGKVGEIDSCDTMVDNFYFGKTLGDIIQEMIKNIKELENKDFRFFYKNQKFHFIKSPKSKYLEGSYTPKSELISIINRYKTNALNYIKEPKLTQDLGEMVNSIRVYKNSGKQYIETSSSKDENNIKKYGLLQQVVSYKENENTLNKKSASKLLKEKNKIKEKINIEIPLLSEFLYDGELLRLDYKEYKISGVYEVTDISYTFTNHNSIFKASIELEKVGD